MSQLLPWLFAASARPIEAASLDEWRGLARAALADFPSPAERAIASGFLSDRLGYAFAGGFQAALSSLIPSLGPDHQAALCASEEKGAHPAGIRAALRLGEGGWTVSGHKRFVTLATAADQLLVLASEGVDPGGRNRLRLARVKARQPGVELVPLQLPIVPEIPHAEVMFKDAAVDEVLPGDGYHDHVKPFRTVEDIYVLAALTGYLLGVGRRAHWPEATIEHLAAAVLAIREIAGEDPRSSSTHIALAGVLEGCRRLVGEIAPLWSSADPAERARFERDAPLLEVAASARVARRERAWRELAR